jgi:predicted RNA binding protein with dsRBD fold (UPF0201 family)
VRVTVEAALALSEDPSKVRTAVENVVGECRHSLLEDTRRVVITSDDNASVIRLHDQLRDRHVRAAAKKLLMVRREGSRSTLMFNRQAAHAGVLALCGSEAESSLGPIYMTIESDRLDDLIEWLTAYETG